MRFRTLLMAAAAAAVLVPLMPAPADAVPTPLLPAPSGRFVRRWSPQWMSHTSSYTGAQATDIAKRFDVVVSMWNVFDEHAATMKAANPNLRVLTYLNGTFGGSGLTSSWYAKSSRGTNVEATDFRGTYMMDLNNPSWTAYVRDRCGELSTKAGSAGCFLDVLGSGPLMGGYLTSAPINSRTGRPWTHTEWVTATAGIGDTTRAGNPSRVVIGNGLGSGRRYFDASMISSILVPHLHGAEPELWLRDAYSGATSYRSEADWKLDIDMVVDSQNRGTPVFTLTKLWAPATEAQKDQWNEFAYASFLLASNGTSYFGFLRDKSPAAITGTSAIDSFEIGTPKAAYYKSGGVYRRDFASGVVLVNPTQTTVTVALGRTYKTWDARSVTSVTLAPYNAKVLKG